ncbi:MAG: glycosyltransferase [Candidatus Sumerlaeaceae bacterium]|nr:glycosyltransferase [Candidatus Sumerlaeaceae bacterium]
MKTVRVLHITPSVRLLGARRSLLVLAAGLAGSRYEPVVLVPSAAPASLTEELDRRKLRWLRLRLPPWRKLGSWAAMAWRVHALRQICAAENIGLIHCNEIYPNPHAVCAAHTGALLPQLASAMLDRRPLGLPRLPIVTHMRLSVTPRMVRNYLLEHATRLIAVSEAAAGDFDPFTWKARKVRVVHNGVDFEEFEAARERRHLVRKQLGFTESDFVIGQIGLLSPRKRPKFTLAAASIILALAPHTRFVFVGEPSPTNKGYLEELQREAVARGIADAVRFVPFQQRVADYFAALDLNLLISNDEGFGRVIIEAAAAGVPTFGSNVGGIPELIRDGETGWILGPRNAPDEVFDTLLPDFAEAVAQLAYSPETARAAGEAARRHCHALFSAERYVEGVARVFDEALEEHAAVLRG